MVDTTWRSGPIKRGVNPNPFDQWLRHWFNASWTPRPDGGFMEIREYGVTGRLIASCKECGALVFHSSNYQDLSQFEDLNTHRSWHDNLTALLNREGE